MDNTMWDFYLIHKIKLHILFCHKIRMLLFCTINGSYVVRDPAPIAQRTVLARAPPTGKSLFWFEFNQPKASRGVFSVTEGILNCIMRFTLLH